MHGNSKFDFFFDSIAFFEFVNCKSLNYSRTNKIGAEGGAAVTMLTGTCSGISKIQSSALTRVMSGSVLGALDFDKIDRFFPKFSIKIAFLGSHLTGLTVCPSVSAFVPPLKIVQKISNSQLNLRISGFGTGGLRLGAKRQNRPYPPH